jgi:translation initiation factor 1
VRREVLTVADRIPTGGGGGLGQNPFEKLNLSGLPSGPSPGGTKFPVKAAPGRNRGRVDIKREKGGRGGKTVTVVDGFIGIGLHEKEQLAKTMRSACGSGGTVKEGRIEIQGDQRDVVAKILTEAGFRPVFAGG